jgi:hypothetical protein
MSSGVFVFNHVLSHDRPVRLVVHHSDDTWQLTCGEYDHDIPKLHFVHVEHFSGEQPELIDLVHELPKGFLAEDVDDVWNKCVHVD